MGLIFVTVIFQQNNLYLVASATKSSSSFQFFKSTLRVPIIRGKLLPFLFLYESDSRGASLQGADFLFDLPARTHGGLPASCLRPTIPGLLLQL